MVQASKSYDPLDGIDWGTKVPGGHRITVFFAPDGVRVDGYTSEGFNDYEIRQFERAFRMFEAVTDLTFDQVSKRSAADLVIGLDFDREMDRDTLGWMNPPGVRHAGQGLFNGRAWDRDAGGDLSVGGYAFVTIVHELLHGLGLAHPHDKGGSSTRFPGVTSAFNDYGPALLNQGIFTTMSYNTGFNKGPTGTSAQDRGFSDFGYEAGPMALDIALLQQKYGVNTTTRIGDTTYTLPDENARGSHYTAIWDTGGRDEIRYDGDRNATIDLRPATLVHERGGGGYVSAAKGIAGGFTIAAGVMIETARGGAGDDKLFGNTGDNLLIGRGGDDTAKGLAGADTIRAGSGDDSLRGGRGADTLKGESGDDTLTGDRGHDTARGGAGVDRITGGDGNDLLGGGPGADRVVGGSGNDQVSGGAGDDRLRGGADADTFMFNARTGHDDVVDFSVAEDMLKFNPGLWGGAAHTAQEIADMAHFTGDGLVWAFGGGNRVILLGITDMTGIADAILV